LKYIKLVQNKTICDNIVYDLAVIENTRTTSLDQDQIGGGETLDTMVIPTTVVMNFSIEKKVCVFLPHAGTYVQPRSIDDMTQPITKKRGPTKNDDDDASTTLGRNMIPKSIMKRNATLTSLL
jgi:hypothetical protein